MATIFKSEESVLMEINKFIHTGKKKEDYHFQHIKLVSRYAILLNKRLGLKLNNKKLTFIALAHDLFKERSLDPKNEGNIVWNNHQIPQDLNRYVRMNLDVLDKFGLGDYFNTDVQLHPLAAGIWLYKEIHVRDPEILYPIMFHSCPIISIYNTLPTKIQQMIDVIILSDKLSSNYLKINLLENDVKIDLDLLVFGENGNELNYSMGLYISRLIAMGKSNGEESKKTKSFYFDRLHKINPFVSESEIDKQIGGNRKWAKRKSRAFRIQ